jgi:hypothetical protein
MGWLSQLWHLAEPAERLDWILDALGLRERVHQLATASLAGIIMLFLQRLKDAPIEWTVIIAIGSAGVTFYFLNQLVQWRDMRKNL